MSNLIRDETGEERSSSTDYQVFDRTLQSSSTMVLPSYSNSGMSSPEYFCLEKNSFAPGYEVQPYTHR